MSCSKRMTASYYHDQPPNAAERARAQSLVELIDAVDRVSREGAARALLLTGQGRAFSAGADLTALGEGASGSRDAGAWLETSFNPPVEKLRPAGGAYHRRQWRGRRGRLRLMRWRAIS